MGKIQERKPSGRPKKFTEESEQVGFKVPKSKVEEFKAYCNEYLNKLAVVGKTSEDFKKVGDKLKSAGKAVKDSKLSLPKTNPEQPIFNVLNKSPYVDMIDPKICDCYIDTNGLLRRGKIECKKNKSQHNF